MPSTRGIDSSFLRIQDVKSVFVELSISFPSAACIFRICSFRYQFPNMKRNLDTVSSKKSRRTCGEGEDVVGVHTLLSGVVQVCHELHVGEEEEKEEEEEQGRQEEMEVKREGQSEETAHVNMDMEMGRMART